MKTWYCVATQFYIDGRISARMTTTEQSERKPDNTQVYIKYAGYMVHLMWLDDKAYAERYVEEINRDAAADGTSLTHVRQRVNNY